MITKVDVYHVVGKTGEDKIWWGKKIVFVPKMAALSLNQTFLLCFVFIGYRVFFFHSLFFIIFLFFTHL